MTIAVQRRCFRTFMTRGRIARPCDRKPVWMISYLGAFCNRHFEEYFTTHAVDPADIKRLSNNEADFVVKTRKSSKDAAAATTATIAPNPVVETSSNG